MHTQGEWLIAKRDGHSNNGVRPVIYTKDVDRIAIISYRGVPSIDEADANAQLIAAAPDLLEALKGIEAYTQNKECSPDFLKDLIRETAKDAIAKATN